MVMIRRAVREIRASIATASPARQREGLRIFRHATIIYSHACSARDRGDHAAAERLMNRHQELHREWVRLFEPE